MKVLIGIRHFASQNLPSPSLQALESGHLRESQPELEKKQGFSRGWGVLGARAGPGSNLLQTWAYLGPEQDRQMLQRRICHFIALRMVRKANI